ncbi:glycerophosphoryl diester phosphodiesterase membrane domain-containing protein [Sphingomonas pituitosa]|uniref:glycerophosphoryl diester phosphodiesterase membrane domain-containing protein n=1 Tax=Sphingomonas pituitosa TaxID=99597 RepID=UPI000AF6A0FF|nr:glycerophosphoryl diester phosphodiesterase membrane domain-containing protein [Sphingomonas pituitosa]
MALPWIAIDATGSDQRLGLLSSLVGVFAQFLLTSALLRREGAHHAWGQPGRAGAFFFAGIVTGLAIAAGMLLLILPGLYLYARWLVTVPLIVGEGERAGEALRASWRRMAPHLRPAIVAVVIVLAPGALALAFPLMAFPEDAPMPIWAVVAVDLLMAGCMVASWYLAVAAHLLVQAAPRAPATP